MRMFEKLGIADQIAPKTKLSMGGPNSRVSVLVSSGEAEIGLQQASELLDNPDVEMIGLLPAGVAADHDLLCRNHGQREAARGRKGDDRRADHA